MRDILGSISARSQIILKPLVKYALDQPDKKLSKLSPKKKLALQCLIYSIDKIDSLPNDVKKSWFGWAYLTVRGISDSEVDELIMSGHFASETYMKVHFRNEFISSFEDPKKREMAKVLFKEYSEINFPTLEKSPTVKGFNDYVI